MNGILYALIAGVFITIQGIFNAKASEKIGLWEINIWVHGTGLVFAFIMLNLFEKGNFKEIKDVNYLYLLGGVLGVMIVFSVMNGINLIGPGLAMAIILITQLTVATVIETYGFFGIEAVKLNITRPLGLVIMAIGILVFSYK